MTPAQEQLTAALKAVHVAMRRMRGRQAQRHNGLSYAQYTLLFALESGCTKSARDLGVAAELSPASVTQMLEGLEASGLVARTRSLEDRRIVLTELTPAGQAALQEMRARMEPAWRAALDGFTEAELLTAATVLERAAQYFTLLADDPEPASDAVGVRRDQAA